MPTSIKPSVAASQPPARPVVDISYKIDEGYSEETRSQDELDSPMGMESNTEEMIPNSLRLAMDSIMSLGETEKSEFVFNVLRTLRTSSIAMIVERLRPYLYKDPVAYLPPEITSEIFLQLSPLMLLEASSVSRSWRERTLDDRLWKRKFHLEGWDLEMGEVQNLEQALASPRKAKTRRAETHEDQRWHKKRIRPGLEKEILMSQDAQRQLQLLDVYRQEAKDWQDSLAGAVEADVEAGSATQDPVLDQEMRDIDVDKVLGTLDHGLTVAPHLGGKAIANEKPTRTANSAEARRTSDISMEVDSQTPLEREPPLVWYSSVGQPRLNYQQLYKQRRKLEENWNACAYTSFQLPHKDHPEEAHGECVYTIQYMGRFLVSGSRDRTLRKWDLETQRLIGKPMTGHSASVLCLQFDNSKEEDIIMSGSSDTNVLIWRYSTGELLERIDQAHREPVLNLKFDSRFLVTCSKDKTIKIWNRRKLSPGDRDYPRRGVKGGGKCPSHIVDLSNVGMNPFDIHKYLRPDQREPLREYSNLMTLDTHSAAVNAIHIYKDQLVSASGDRFVKVWDIHTGECTATCRGHQKGIACVQYDGKRIISGSSDNTIRIYDPATQAEVACLQGHTRLVRTIQSAFEDQPGSREELEMEAEEVDRRFFLANGSEELASSVRNRSRNPGSNHPKDIMAIGAKLPPGGGGSRWGRIVSGSYDETIIIWRKGLDGRWVPSHRLRQEEALRAAGPPLATRSEMAAQIPFTAQRPRNTHQVQTTLQIQNHAAAQANTAQQQTIGRQQQQPQPSPRVTEVADSSQPRSESRVRSPNEAQTSSRTSSLHQAIMPPTSSTQLNDPYPNWSRTVTTSDSDTASPSSHHLQQQQPSASYSSHNNASTSQASNRPPPTFDNQNPAPSTYMPPSQLHAQPSSSAAPATTTSRTPPSHRPPPPPPPTHVPPVPPIPHNIHHQVHPHPNPQTQAAQQQPHHHHPAPGAGGAVQQPNARVFKLQFDARRIVCCSQDPKIVGWDFANGDERVVEASKYFGAPQ